ncbi:MAG: single-stranded DNA-binding protein [Syntrophomonadaceae bacterium]|mgnify:CR=1 FL=1|nr:single-stranded DNA-binding protein [Syntrophomonadaceae bacterium]
MLNRVILIGRLTRDPELRYTGNGIAVCTFSLAVNRPYVSQGGERQADFIDIVAWRGLAENVANYMTKGRLVAVEGRLQVRSYENQEGQKRKAVEVVADSVKFLERASGSGSGPSAKRSSDSDSWESLGREIDPGGVDIMTDDDEIPF